MKSTRIFVGIFFIILLIGLAGCSGADAERTAATQPPAEAEPTSLPTEPPPPAATPLPPVGVLFAPDGADPALVDALQTHLTQAIPAAGLRYQMRPSLSIESIQADDIQKEKAPNDIQIHLNELLSYLDSVSVVYDLPS